MDILSGNINNFLASYYSLLAHYQLRCIVLFIFKKNVFLKPKNVNTKGSSINILKLVLHKTELPGSKM